MHALYLNRAIASCLKVVWPKSCGRKHAAARRVWWHAPPGKIFKDDRKSLLRPFLAENACNSWQGGF